MIRRVQQTRGMTLVELMIVVVIIGILASIAVVGYHKYVARARLSEATAMLAEFSSKEQLYFLDSGQFLEAHNAVPKYPSESEEAGEFWPQNPNEDFDSARTPAAVNPVPDSWRALGIRPRWQQLYCTYMANVGAENSRLPGTVGPTLWTSPPKIPWFYVIAACNLAGKAGWPNSGAAVTVTTLVITHDSPLVRTTDENQ